MTAWSKRRFLRGTGAALLATGTAGCLGSGKTGIGDSKNFEDVSYNADTKKLTVTIFTSPAIAPNHDDVVLVAFDRADDLKPAVYLDGEVDDTEFTFNFNGVITGTQTYRVTVAFKGGGGRADLFFNLAGGQVSVERLVEP